MVRVTAKLETRYVNFSERTCLFFNTWPVINGSNAKVSPMCQKLYVYFYPIADFNR